MTALCIALSLLFTWLLYETQWLTVRLPQYVEVVEYPSCEIAYAKWLTEMAVYSEHNVRCFIPRPDYSEKRVYAGYVITHNSDRCWDKYTVQLSPGIENVLCDNKWLNKHWNDLKDYEPTIELILGTGYKQTMTIRKDSILKQVIKLNTGKKFLRQLA